jgi:predicted metal-dependent peptidase
VSNFGCLGINLRLFNFNTVQNMSTLTKSKKEEYLLELNQYLVTFCQEFAPVILKIPRVYKGGDYLFKTDGKIVKVGDKFFSLDVHKQLFKSLQVSMHIALRHPQRARDIYNNEMALKIWNVSTDLVINNAVKDYVDQKLKTSGNSLESEFTLTVLNVLTQSIPDFNLDENNAEQVFEKILRFIDQSYIPNIDNQTLKTIQDLMDMLSEIENEFQSSDFEDSSQVLKDNGLDSEDTENTESQNLIWSKRLDNVIDKIAGTMRGTNILKLRKELPKVKVDWRKVLREFLTTRLLQEREPNWKRPSRRVTAGISEFYEPYRDRKKGIKKLALCWDISGSCFSDDTISQFVANIEAVHSITSCELILIPFDTQVVTDEIFRLHYHEKLSELLQSGDICLSGGGGTDFNPPIEYATDIQPDVIVVLTDCYGPFPENAPNIPVLWACTEENMSAPWGKTLYIGDN